MEKPASGTQKKRKRSGPSPALWITLVFLATVVISAGFTHASGVLLDGSGIYAALAVLLLIILIGIAFDILGVAVTAAPDQPLHSMAARKVRGAKEAIGLTLPEGFSEKANAAWNYFDDTAFLFLRCIIDRVECFLLCKTFFR